MWTVTVTSKQKTVCLKRDDNCSRSIVTPQITCSIKSQRLKCRSYTRHHHGKGAQIFVRFALRLAVLEIKMFFHFSLVHNVKFHSFNLLFHNSSKQLLCKLSQGTFTRRWLKMTHSCKQRHFENLKILKNFKWISCAKNDTKMA